MLNKKINAFGGGPDKPPRGEKILWPQYFPLREGGALQGGGEWTDRSSWKKSTVKRNTWRRSER